MRTLRIAQSVFLIAGAYLVMSSMLYDRDQTTEITMVLGDVTFFALSMIFAGLAILKKDLERLIARDAPGERDQTS